MNPGLVVKLRPAGPWRIGPDSGARNRVDAIYHSDSLYSAVTSAMSRLGSLEEWLDATARSQTPAVCFSSCFPFLEDVNFVVPPRTIWPPTSPAAMSARVRWKSARFIPLSLVESMLEGKRLNDNLWSVDGASGCLVPAGKAGPFRTSVRWNAAVDRLSGTSERFSTACIEFREGCGLWTVAGFRDDQARDEWQEKVKAAFRLLADSGFGGERSRGWGRAETPEFVEGALPGLIIEYRQKAPAAPEPALEAQAPVPAPPIEEPPVEEPPITEPPPSEEPGPAPVPPVEGAAEATPAAGPETELPAAAESSAPEVVVGAEGPLAPEPKPVSQGVAESTAPEVVAAPAEQPVAAEPAAPEAVAGAEAPVAPEPEPVSPAVAAPPAPEADLRSPAGAESATPEMTAAADAPAAPTVEPAPPAAAESAAPEVVAGAEAPLAPEVEPAVPAAAEPAAPGVVAGAEAAVASVESAPPVVAGPPEPEVVAGAEAPPAPEVAAAPPAVAEVPAPEVEAAADAPPAPEPEAAPLAAAESPAPEVVAAPAEPPEASGPAVSEPPAPEVVAAAAEPPAPAESAPEIEAALSDAPISAVVRAPGRTEAMRVAPERESAAIAPVPAVPLQAHWLLSLFTPAAADAVDWGRGSYAVLARGGRIESPSRGSGDLKKQIQMVAEGSVLYADGVPLGAAADVAPDGFAHPVFRAGFALAIPLPEVH